tara:strand:- start:2486 stop:2785 length:300 start_codon:yes stop_codon:yes gene_type:complete
MFKKFNLLLCLLLLSNCVSHSSALLAPVITGARTGSIYQASLSFGSGKLMNNFRKTELYDKKHTTSSNEISYEREPLILMTYVIDNVLITEVLEPEPLP